jgi:hypothetical protein
MDDIITTVREEYSDMESLTYRQTLAYLLFELMVHYPDVGFRGFTTMTIAINDEDVTEGGNYIFEGKFYFDDYRGRRGRYSDHRGLIISDIPEFLQEVIRFYLNLRFDDSNYFLVDREGIPIVNYHRSYYCRLLYDVIGISIYDIKRVVDGGSISQQTSSTQQSSSTQQPVLTADDPYQTPV